MIYSFPQFIQQWITKAENDVKTAEILLEHPPIILDNACFHCQQAVEKYLKAFLIYHKKEILKTHDIEFLIEECAKIDSSFTEIDLKDISSFAVKYRYPSDYLDPTVEEAHYYYNVALTIREQVLRKIQH